MTPAEKESVPARRERLREVVRKTSAAPRPVLRPAPGRRKRKDKKLLGRWIP